MAVGLRHPIPSWLLASRGSLLLESTLIHSHVAPFFFRASNTILNVPHALNLRLPHLLLVEKALCF